jgi:hypothetical protein
MRRTVEKMFRRYGTELTLHTDAGKVPFRGFLHFITSRSLQNTLRNMTVLGEDPSGQFVLIMPADVEAARDDTVEQAGKQYLLRQLEPMLYRDQVLYQWGLCVKKGGD